MPYTFKLPRYMRLFERTKPKSTMLCRTGEVLSEGKTVQVDGVEVKTYDHRDQKVLKLTDGRYLLVEESDDDIRERSCQ